MTAPAPRTRRRGVRIGAAVVLVLLAAAVWSGVRAVLAKGHLDAARGQLEVARTALLDRRLDAADAAVTSAGRDTRAGRRLTGDPVTWVLAHVPVLGNSLAVARGISAGADDIARRVLPGALKAAALIDPKTLRGPDGTVDVALLRRAAPGLASAAATSRQVARDVHGLPTLLVPGVVARGRATFDAQAATLARTLSGASDAVSIAPALLGEDRPRRWFVLVQQTDESRGTGGLPGGFAVVDARRGRVKVLTQGSNADLDLQRVVAPGPGIPTAFVDRYSPLATFSDWRNVNVSPDLPVVARVVAQRWAAQGGTPVDGVITLDAVALADLLRGAAPIPVSAGRTITADTVVQYLSLGQYVGVSDQAGRKEQLVGVARAAIGQLTGGSGDTAQTLRGLVEALTSGHLHMASDDPAVAPVLARTGVDAHLPAGAAPVAYPVVFNASGGKLDQFLTRSVSYRAGSCDGPRRRSTITVTLRSDPPALASLPPYVTIRADGAPSRHSLVNHVGLSVYATRGALLTDAALDGRPLPLDLTANVPDALQVGTEAGLPVWLTYLDLPPGADRTLVLHLVEPTSPGSARVPEQALATPLRREVSVPACG